MANFFSDNRDLEFTLNNLDLLEAVALRENNYEFAKEFAKNCRIDVDCSFGSITILVPKSLQVVPNSSTAFAGVDIQGCPDASATSVIHLDADVSFGSITVCYT